MYFKNNNYNIEFETEHDGYFGEKEHFVIYVRVKNLENNEKYSAQYAKKWEN